MTNAHTPLAPVDLFDLAAGLRSLTSEIVAHVDDPRPSPLLFGLAVAAENLASQLADATWEMVENATEDTDPLPKTARTIVISPEAAEALDRLARDLGGSEWRGNVASSLILDAMDAAKGAAPIAGGAE